MLYLTQPCCAVEELHGPHELELLEAASACWVVETKTVQVPLHTQVLYVNPENPIQSMVPALIDWNADLKSSACTSAAEFSGFPWWMCRHVVSLDCEQGRLL